MKLNLACGRRRLDDYVNIDVVETPEVDIVHDCLDLSDLYQDESVDAIFSEHFIEHLDKNEIRTFFAECNRLLKSGGGLVLIAPDLETGIEKFSNDLDELDSFLFANHTHEHDYHKQGIYPGKLRILCDKFRFMISEITKQSRPHSPNEIKLVARKL